MKRLQSVYRFYHVKSRKEHGKGTMEISSVYVLGNDVKSPPENKNIVSLEWPTAVDDTVTKDHVTRL